MKIAVLDLTSHPEPDMSGQPRVGQLIHDWLAPALPEAEIFAVDVAQGGAMLPALSGFDGVVISGSEAGVYDDTPWMTPLRQFLLACKSARKPIFGICFGHQIMADTFGGKAEKAKAGNIVGARQFTLKGAMIDAHVWHQDQVVIAPPQAAVTATAPYCPIAALEYDFPAASVQFHPEYSAAHLRDLWDIFRGKFLTEQERADAITSVAGVSVPVDLQAKETAAFFRAHCVG
ncbi:type 1 glutamine amidotransferase [Roseobacter sp. N2S]|uniref:type 1 glutamine amidotransferase n=1 Tax=Roseobacter sp. N2S TaxID=2663844 RepID=UPI00285686C0|nr:type 1 glutamine amidotransferase [Roseobacter sp. N2S]MDR6266483.1 GMP synthase-like glutamine amidotransferase [Roseobacter sp. N2S]